MKKYSTIAKLPEMPVQKGEPYPDRKNDEALIALIKRAGKSAVPFDEGSDPIPSERRLSLRIPGEIAIRIKQAAKARQIKTSSHSWIVEAILEKLKKESF